MRGSGFTIFELLVVVAILAIVAFFLVGPPLSVNDDKKLDLAASEVAAALRFGRSAAIRTGEHHGTRFGAADERIRVYRLDTSPSPPVEEYDVYHPVDKKLYDLPIDTAPFTLGVTIAAAVFQFGGDPTPHESVAFAETGIPVSPIDLTLMDQGLVALTYAGQTRVIQIAPMTGRVHVQ